MVPGTYLLSTAGNCLTDLSNIGVTVTKLSTNEFVLSGIYSGVFQGSKYIFVMRDGSIKELPIGSNEDYRALVEYSPPPSKRNDVQILFDLEFSTASELANITQSVHFSFTNAANILQNLVRSR